MYATYRAMDPRSTKEVRVFRSMNGSRRVVGRVTHSV